MSSIPLSRGPLEGKFVTLIELNKDDIPNLWQNLGLPETSWLWQWLLSEAPKDQNGLREQFKQTPGEIVYAIRGDLNHLNHHGRTDDRFQQDRTEVLGVVAYLNIDKNHRALDIGAVVLSPALQRTAAATEAIYLLLRHVFEDKGMSASPLFRRVMWKLNSMNSKSRRAAERLGFTYEGTLRRHRLVKGKWINSDWLSIVEDEWPAVRTALENWLSRENFDDQGKQKRTLDEIKAGLA